MVHAWKKLIKNQKGQTITEAMMCMLLICLITFSMLQMFYLSVANVFTDFAAFKAARSRAVGFADYIVNRTAQAASIGASGKMLNGDTASYTEDPISMASADILMIRDYLSGIRYLDYEYWHASNNTTKTSLSTSASSSTNGGMAAATVTFNNYPLNFPMAETYTKSGKVQVDYTVNMTEGMSFAFEGSSE